MQLKRGSGFGRSFPSFVINNALTHCNLELVMYVSIAEERMVSSRRQQTVITPHKRRGPIAAEFSSPGPASIKLPGLIGGEQPQL